MLVSDDAPYKGYSIYWKSSCIRGIVCLSSWRRMVLHDQGHKAWPLSIFRHAVRTNQTIIFSADEPKILVQESSSSLQLDECAKCIAAI